MDTATITGPGWCQNGWLSMSDQLRAACIHGRYEAHDDYDDGVRIWPGCPGGRHLTVGEVVEWIRGQDADLLERLAADG